MDVSLVKVKVKVANGHGQHHQKDTEAGCVLHKKEMGTLDTDG